MTENLSTINKEALRDLANFIEKETDYQFDMAEGTTCYLGFAMRMVDEIEDTISDSDCWSILSFSNYFRLSDFASWDLTHPNISWSGLKSIHCEYGGYGMSRDNAVKLLREIADEKVIFNGLDWVRNETVSA